MAKIDSFMLVTGKIPQSAIDETFKDAEKAMGREFNCCIAYIHKRVECEEIIDTERCRIYRPTRTVISYDVCLDFYNAPEDAVKEQAKTLKQIKDEFGDEKYSYIHLLKKDVF